MIYIKKGAPPNSVATKVAEIKRTSQWRAIPEVRPSDPDSQNGYSDTLRTYFDQLPKDDIREALLEEQHHVCAYCMRHLSNKQSARIEHWFPLSQARDTAIDYRNFLAVCDGVKSEQQQRHPCCDVSKGGTEITLDPRCQWMMDQIRYESNGRVYFEVPTEMDSQLAGKISNDIDVTLRLNGSESDLTIGRRRVYESCKKTMEKLQRNHKCSVANVEKLLHQMESQEAYPDYVGVMMFYYKRWLKNHSK